MLAALQAALPHERFIYLGDTARVPYGSKPLAMVREFASEITAELLARDVKAVVIACNTASAASLPELAVRSAVPVWGVVEPGVTAALRAGGDDALVGVLGTAATIEARVYQDRLEAAGATTWARACPLLVPLVEEGLQDSDIARLVVEHYLCDRPALSSLILGCTHYPLLKPVLRAVLGESVAIVDSSEVVAEFVATELERLGLRADGPASEGRGKPASGRLEYLVTGDVDVFLHSVGRLGGIQAPATRVVMNGTRRGIWPIVGRAKHAGTQAAGAPVLRATSSDRTEAA